MIKKILLTIVVVGSTLLLGITGTAYLFRDQIIQGFIKEANQYLKTPVNVDRISLDIFNNFPNLSIKFSGLEISGSSSKVSDTLARLDNIYCALSLTELANGNYSIKQLVIEGGRINLWKNGEVVNYQIIDNKGNQIQKNNKDTAFSFSIEKIRLNNVHVNYRDIGQNQDYKVMAKKIVSSFQYGQAGYQINLEGKLVSNGIGIGGKQYFENKNISIRSDLTLNDRNGDIQFKKSTIGVNQSEFLWYGRVNASSSNLIDLNISGKNTDMQTLISLLPRDYSEYFTQFKSRGNVYFDGSIKRGNTQASPSININFGAKNATLVPPHMQSELNDLSFSGNFTNGSQNALQTTSLDFNNINGNLDGFPVAGDLRISNFNDHFIQSNADLKLSIRSILAFFPDNMLRDGSGHLDADVKFSGKLADFKNASKSREIKASGDIAIKNLNLKIKQTKLPFRKVNGHLTFNNADLAISDLSGYVGSSHFLLNGFLTNVFPFLLMDNQPIGIQADLHSELLDLDELLSGNLSIDKETMEKLPRRRASKEEMVMNNLWHQTTDKQEYSFSIHPKLKLDFNCEIERLKFRRFKGWDIKGNLGVKDQLVTLNAINFQTAGGKIQLNGSLNARHKNRFRLKTNANLKRMAIDSIFYIFENFNQEFLVADHLDGRLDAGVQAKMYLDSTLSLYSNTLVVDANTRIIDGKLVNFDPLQKLSSFIDEEKLANVAFSELVNGFHISDRTVYIPEMEIKTNVSNIKIQGEHTFDQEIHYKIQVPLRELSPKLKAMQKKSKARSASFGTIKNDGSGRTQLFLSLDGTTDDYKISYDSEAVKAKIKEDLKKEGQELKEAFKNKGKDQNQSKQLKEEEYFDF